MSKVLKLIQYSEMVLDHSLGLEENSFHLKNLNSKSFLKILMGLKKVNLNLILKSFLKDCSLILLKEKMNLSLNQKNFLKDCSLILLKEKNLILKKNFSKEKNLMNVMDLSFHRKNFLKDYSLILLSLHRRRLHLMNENHRLHRRLDA
jgi:hypothetical protein